MVFTDQIVNYIYSYAQKLKESVFFDRSVAAYIMVTSVETQLAQMFSIILYDSR